MPWPAASYTGPIARAGLFERLMRRHSSIRQPRGLRPNRNSSAPLLQYAIFFYLCTIVRLRRWRGGPRAIHGHTLVTHSDIINRQTTVGVRGIITDEIPLDENSLSDCLRRDRKPDRRPVIVEYFHVYRRFFSQLTQV